MRTTLLKLCCFTIALATASRLQAADAGTAAMLRLALDAQGGESKLRALKSEQYEAEGYRHLLEASVKVTAERVALSPARLLLTALDANDSRTEPDVRLHGINHHVVSFMLDGAPVRIYLNPYTHLPTAFDYAGPAAHTDGKIG
jgi:hypothetical protein